MTASTRPYSASALPNLPLPEPALAELLTEPIRDSLARLLAARAEYHRVRHVIDRAEETLGVARRDDAAARVAAVQSGEADPGDAHERRAFAVIAQARRDEPVRRQLALTAYDDLVRVVQSDEQVGQDLARRAVTHTRKTADALDQAERAVAERERCRALLAWVRGVQSDGPVPRVTGGGIAARSAAYAARISALRTEIGDAGPEIEVSRYPGNGAKRATEEDAA